MLLPCPGRVSSRSRGPVRGMLYLGDAALRGGGGFSCGRPGFVGCRYLAVCGADRARRGAPGRGNWFTDVRAGLGA